MRNTAVSIAVGVACAGITVLMAGAICCGISKRKAFYGIQAQKRRDIEEAAKYYFEAKNSLGCLQHINRSTTHT